MNSTVIAKKIKKRIDEKYDIMIFRKRLLSYHAYDLANAFMLLDDEYQKRLYEILSPKDMSLIFSYIETDKFISLVKNMDIRYASMLISCLPKDEAADIIKELENPDDYLRLMNKELSVELKLLAKYDNDFAGSMMNTDYISVDDSSDVKSAMKKIVSNANRVEAIDTIFVVNDSVLIGTIKLKDLFTSDGNTIINEIMSEAFISVDINEKAANVIDIIEEHNIKTLPVLENGVLKGIITIDDWFDFAYEEDSEDYNMLAGIVSNDLDSSIMSSIKKRIPWLSILLVLSLIVSSVISVFDGVISKITVLVFFQTLVLDMAGNAGTQGLAVSVRSISKGDFDEKNEVKKHLKKEIRIGLIDGILLGILAFISAYIYLLIAKVDNSVMIALVVGLAMLIALLISTFVGSLTPLVFKKLKIDPAVASGPFITTLNDCLSVTIYYTLAYLLLLII